MLIMINNSLQAQTDEYLWLEDINGQKSMEFVKAQSKITYDKLSQQKSYQPLYDKLLGIYNSSDRIAYPSIQGKFVYNFWKDENHERGIWRRCLRTNYVEGSYDWETLLDLDSLSEKESLKWVYKGTVANFPICDRFLVYLSKGGGDAVVIREFDPNTKEFLKDGFSIDEAKSTAYYVDNNTLVVSTDFGKGSLSISGYPIQVKLWNRGTPIKDARLIYSGSNFDMAAIGTTIWDGAKIFTTVLNLKTFFTSKKLIWLDDKMLTVDIPDDCVVSNILKNQLLISLKSDWKVNNTIYKEGALISLDIKELLEGNKIIQNVYEPDSLSSISNVAVTKNKLLVNVLNNVISELYIYSFTNNTWIKEKAATPDMGIISIISTDNFSDQYFCTYENLLTPSTLYSADASTNILKPVSSLPAYFDASKYEVKQLKATSKDGTLIPYFIVTSKEMKHNGTNPTVIYSYGGFEFSMEPEYASTYGPAWLDQGGVFVVANIRGGGEFGPKWHTAGIKDKRQNVFDDLYAVSEDLITNKVTSPKHLGIFGTSNGGLLVGVALTQRPDLYNAIVCSSPLLDMQRYNKLLAGNSWMGEYGNPDKPKDWEYIQKYSPYQNVKKNMNYPEVLFTTATTDDRVHPGHARKMFAKMNDMGYRTFFYENTEGGHAGSSTNEQKAKLNAMIFSYFSLKLK